MNKILRRTGVASLAALLSACVSFQTLEPALQPLDRVDMSSMSGSTRNNEWPNDNWWTMFGDAQLDRLIKHGLSSSPTLAGAQARIARAQAAAAFARASDSPQVNAGLDASYGRQSENYLIPKPPLGKGGEYVSQGQAAISFGMDLDLWGRNAALIRAAGKQLQAAEFDHAAARLALTTSIARAYAQLAGQYDLQDVLLATLKQRQDIRSLIDKRVASGLDTQVEVKQADTNVAALKVELEQLATAMKVSRLQLAALAGDMPAAADNISRPAMRTAEPQVPSTLPLDLLGRRPELAAQRARIAAAIGDAEAAKAQFYPNINLNAMLGFQAIGLDRLLDAGSFTNSIGPAIRLPIFDAGRLRANYAGKISDVDAAIAQYNQSVLNAAQEVSEQLVRLSDLVREEAATQEALAAAEEAHRLAMLRYRGGLSPYLTVLTVESQLLAQRRAMSLLRARRDDLQISLLRALGGGFDESRTKPATAQTH